jgi:hypothetical protein
MNGHAVVWYGQSTKRWWAMHPALPYLVEAPSPAALAAHLDAALSQTSAASRPPRYARRRLTRPPLPQQLTFPSGQDPR